MTDRNNSQPASPAGDSGLAKLHALAATLHDLHREKAASLAPIVQNLLYTHSRDVNEIEHTLDHLLDCACIPEGLALFKALCRHYYDIDPAATAAHIMAYREWYDADSIEPAKPAKRKKPAKASPRGVVYGG